MTMIQWRWRRKELRWLNGDGGSSSSSAVSIIPLSMETVRASRAAPHCTRLRRRKKTNAKKPAVAWSTDQTPLTLIFCGFVYGRLHNKFPTNRVSPQKIESLRQICNIIHSSSIVHAAWGTTFYSARPKYDTISEEQEGQRSSKGLEPVYQSITWVSDEWLIGAKFPVVFSTAEQYCAFETRNALLIAISLVLLLICRRFFFYFFALNSKPFRWMIWGLRIMFLFCVKNGNRIKMNQRNHRTVKIVRNS